MKRSFWPVLISCLVLLAGSGLCTPQKTYLTILHTNDTHGHLLPFSYPTNVPPGSELSGLSARRNIGGNKTGQFPVSSLKTDIRIDL